MSRPDLAYRGRLAPTPSGYLHLGHARTFWTAAQRARAANGVLIFREEDLDTPRCRPEYAAAALEDLRWFGLTWQEGPDVGGPYGPYRQSQRSHFYRAAWSKLLEGGHIYPSPHSRQDVQRALQAPHEEETEAVFPVELRPAHGSWSRPSEPTGMNWRFRVPDGETISFTDQRLGAISSVAGLHFGDFIVWRKDGLPAYDLAVVVDDHAMGVTEVVRGEDLVRATARQLLLYRALGWPAPVFYHCPLMRDDQGKRLAKRHASLSLRALAQSGRRPEDLRVGLRTEEMDRLRVGR